MLMNCNSCGVSYKTKNRIGVYTNRPNICSSKCFKKLLDKSKKFYAEELTPYKDKITSNENRQNSKYYRSKYEIFFANWCMSHNVNYQYEPFRFKLDNGSVYIIDFYLPEYFTFVEVKGIWEGSAKTKFLSFINEFPFTTYLLDLEGLRLLKR